MRAPQSPRHRERGNSILLALIVLSSLAALGSLTVVSVQSSLKASTNDRSQTVAMYAAESGGVIAIEYLRKNFSSANGWSAYVLKDAVARPLLAAQLPASGALPTDADNPFSPDLNAYFEIEVINNRTDPRVGAASDWDGDGQIIVRAKGHGPQGSLAVIEWEIQRISPSPPGPALPAPVGTDVFPVVPTSYPVAILSWRTIL